MRRKLREGRKIYKHIYIHNIMARVISISDEVYDLLKSLKREGESFSEVIKRLARKSSISNFSGVLSKDSAEKIEKIINNLNEKTKERMREL